MRLGMIDSSTTSWLLVECIVVLYDLLVACSMHKRVSLFTACMLHATHSRLFLALQASCIAYTLSALIDSVRLCSKLCSVNKQC
jgi:hypothetical protein